MIKKLTQAVKKRTARERAISNFSTRYWRQVDEKGYDIAIIGSRKAVRNLVRFADEAQRKKINRIIAPHQIEKLVPKLVPKKYSKTKGIDLIVIPHQDDNDSILGTVRKYLMHSIPIYTMFEGQLISKTIPEQNQIIDIDKQKTLPEQTYIVASTRRTGSTMLCNLLQKTGVLGYPDEYIEEGLSVLTEERMINPGYVLEEALKLNQTPNGVFGIKLHWSALERFNEAVFPNLDAEERVLFENLLCNSHYIFLSRRNKIRQAISDWRAIGTRIFNINKNSKDSVRKQYGKRLQYDYVRLKRHLVNFVKRDQAWRNYFETNNIDPIEIVYEDFIKHPEEAIRTVLNHLSESCANPEFTPNTNRLSDGYTEEIYEQFVEDLEREYGKDMTGRLEGIQTVNDINVKKEQRKKHVLVTLATRAYLDMAKQLFSSAYFNGGWDGDFLLLAHEIPEEELSWFRERGVIIKHTPPLYEGCPGGMHSCIASKFYMFTPYFKKWRTVIYSDLDAVIKKSLDELKDVEGFWAVEDWSPTILDQIVSDEEIDQRALDRQECREVIQRVEQLYEISRRPFCAGFLAFSTDIITENMFAELKETMDGYHMISKHGDQLSFNLYFYDMWRKLNPTFNVLVSQVAPTHSYDIPAHTRWGVAEDLNAYVLHIFNPKPWDERSSYYWEWLMNLKRAHDIGRCEIDKDFAKDIEKIKRTERRIQLREKTYDLIERYLPFKGTAIRTLNFIYWRYIFLRRIIRFISSNTDSRFIKRLLSRAG